MCFQRNPLAVVRVFDGSASDRPEPIRADFDDHARHDGRFRLLLR